MPVSPDLLWLAGGAGGLVLVAFVIVWLRRRPAGVGKAVSHERLADYPPPPPAGDRRLLAQGEPARLRLVVVAPAGRQGLPGGGDVEAILSQIVRELGEVARQDRPRIRILPPQLSAQGFPPTFLRMVETPQPAGTPSRWQTICGPARIGPSQVLLGVVVLTDQAAPRSPMILQPHQWPDILRVERT